MSKPKWKTSWPHWWRWHTRCEWYSDDAAPFRCAYGGEKWCMFSQCPRRKD